MSFGLGIPGAVAARLSGRRSRAAFSWSADDLSLTPRVGPALTLTRAGANGGLVRDYWGRGHLPNHSAPRFMMFDLDGDGYHEAPALLLEPATTNKILRSQEFDNASWTKTRCSVTANALIAPDGTLTADKLVEDATASATHFIQQGITLAAAGNRFAVSCFVRAGERTQVMLRGTDNTNMFQGVFDLASLTATTTTAGTGVAIRAYMEPWDLVEGVRRYRCVVIGTAGSATTAVNAFGMLATGGNNTYSGDGASGLYIWGFQAEETENGASSYLPTVASTVTRTAEGLTATWPLLPGPLTLYAQLIEIGQSLDSVSSKPLIMIGDATTRMILQQSVNGITPRHDNGPNVVGNQSAVSGLSIGNLFEAIATIDPTGAANSAYAVSGGAAVTGTISAALSFATAYGGSPVKLGIGSQEGTTTPALVAVRAIRIAAGARTLEQMRGMR